MAIPDKPFQWVANFTQVPNEFFEIGPYLTEPELRIMLYAIRHTIGWHDKRDSREAHISIRNFAFGYTKDGIQYEGTRLTEVTIRKALPELVRLGLLEKVGGVTDIGQKWKLPQGCNASALLQREQDRYEKDQLRTVNGRKKAEEMRLSEAGGLSHNPPLSDNGGEVYPITLGGVIPYPQVVHKEEQKEKETTLRPAIAERAEADSPSHTPILEDEASEVASVKRFSAQAEKRMRPAATPSPSLKQKASTAQNTNSSHPHSAPPLLSTPDETEIEAVKEYSAAIGQELTGDAAKDKKPAKRSEKQQAHDAMIEGLRVAMAVGRKKPDIPLQGPEISNYASVAGLLVKGGIQVEDFLAYVEYWNKAAQGWPGGLTLNSLTKPGRITDFKSWQASRPKNAISGISTGGQVSTTPNVSKRAYDKRSDPAYAYLHDSLDEQKQAK